MSVAVINLGGKQFTVEPGKIIDVPHLDQKPESILALTDLLAGKTVEAKVLSHGKGDKLRVVKFKNKTRYTRTIGHRDHLTRVEITAVK